MKAKLIRNNVFWVRHICRASKTRLFLNVLITIVQAVFNFIFDVYIFLIVVDGWQKGESFSSICRKVVLICIAQIIFLVIKNWFKNCYVPQSNNKIDRYMRKLVFEKMKGMDLYCYDDPDFYNAYIRAMNEIASRTDAFMNSVNSLIHNLFAIFSMSFVIFTIDPVFFVIAFIPLFVSFFIGKAQVKKRVVYYKETQANEREKDYIRRIFYSKEYAEEMRTTGVFLVLIRHFDDIMKCFQTIVRKHGFKMALYEYLDYMLMDVVVYLGGVTVAIYKTVNRTIAVSGALIVANTISSVSWSIRNFSDSYVEFQEHAMYIDGFLEFLNYQPKINDDRAKMISPNHSRSLTIKNLFYTYPGNDKPTLKDINIDIQPGQKIAILGPNGSGKSTLIKLIMRYYQPDSGRIELDGRDVSEYFVKDYRKSFGTVFQDFHLFAFSVLDNLLLKDNIDVDERGRALHALELASMMDTTERMGRGIDTRLTKEFDKDGAVLSGGERQKLAVARLFAKEYPYLIVDEPTSALDPLTEYSIFKKILDYSKDKSVIFISHRLSSAVFADRIYYMDHGEVVETGTHKELLALNGKYASFWDKQVRLYGEESQTDEVYC